jgi:Transposase domain (DUF772)
MSRRDLSQPSFIDAMVSGYGKVGGFLDRIEQGFDWSAFEALLSPIHGSAAGAPGYPPLTMFRIVLLQQWHTLSDPGAATGCRSAVFVACRWTWRRQTMPRSGGFARRSTSLAWPRSSSPRSTGSSTPAVSSSSAARWSMRPSSQVKRWYGMSRVRYLGLARNACHLQFAAMAMNMKRALVMMRAT